MPTGIIMLAVGLIGFIAGLLITMIADNVYIRDLRCRIAEYENQTTEAVPEEPDTEIEVIEINMEEEPELNSLFDPW